MANRILLQNAWLADGKGSPLQPGNLLIEGQVIADVGPSAQADEAQKIDCTNLVVAPGFIDAHSHSDLQVLQGAREKLLQGVTSEVVGNCGFSPYPLSESNADDLRQFANGILYGDEHWGWRSASDYLLAVHEKAQLASVASLVGHGSLRIAHAGLEQGPLAESALQAMERTLDEALMQGASGFSTGLMYAPGSSAPKEELVRLCRVVAKRNRMYCSHIRSYSAHLLDAIDEQIELARTAQCSLQISHLQAVGRENWRLNSIALERIETARKNGIDVMFDCYPYVAGSTVLTQMLPQWALAGGTERLLERLSDAAIRREMAKQIEDAMVHQWSDIFISAVDSEENAEAVGQSLAEIAKDRGVLPMDCVFDLLASEKGKVNILQFNQSEENLRANLSHPLSMIISDGFYVKGRPHPRLHGAFPELLGNICRDKQWMSLPEAIHKVTGAPSARFSLWGRGYLRIGYMADITVFDRDLVRGNATYQDPTAGPTGLSAVYRAGKLVLANDDRFSIN